MNDPTWRAYDLATVVYAHARHRPSCPWPPHSRRANLWRACSEASITDPAKWAAAGTLDRMRIVTRLLSAIEPPTQGERHAM